MLSATFLFLSSVFKPFIFLGFPHLNVLESLTFEVSPLIDAHLILEPLLLPPPLDIDGALAVWVSAEVLTRRLLVAGNSLAKLRSRFLDVWFGPPLGRLGPGLGESPLFCDGDLSGFFLFSPTFGAPGVRTRRIEILSLLLLRFFILLIENFRPFSSSCLLTLSLLLVTST